MKTNQTLTNIIIVAILYGVTKWCITMGTIGELISIPLSFVFLFMVIMTIIHFIRSIGSEDRERKAHQDEIDHQAWWDSLSHEEQVARNAEAKRLSEIVPELKKVQQIKKLM